MKKRRREGKKMRRWGKSRSEGWGEGDLSIWDFGFGIEKILEVGLAVVPYERDYGAERMRPETSPSVVS